MFLDLDHFKLVNDGLGHHVGDLLLKQVSEELTTLLRPEDTVARFGGDEFVLIANEVQDLTDVTDIAERVISRLATPMMIGHEEIAVSASLGIALYPLDGENVEELLKNADAAMYHAKALGRNTFSFYRKEMNGSILEKFGLKAKLAKAIDHGELALHYQPQAYSRNVELVGCEALLRWNHPDLGRIPPDRFIPLAEETGLIVPIGEWVLLSACKFAADLKAQGVGFGRVAVNLSARQFYQSNLAQMVERTLSQTGLPPQCLELEITESMMMGNTEKVLQILSELKEMKIQLAVDDFGTGYSNLGYLQVQIWAGHAAKKGHVVPLRFVPDLRARLVAGLVRRWGPRRLRAVLSAMKVRGMSLYAAARPGHAMPQSVAEVGRRHRGVETGGNLRAAVFGINDGLISNASLILGVAGATADPRFIVLSGAAGLIAGAFSMAAGEYVSVRSQKEMYEYQIRLEKEELEQYPEEEAEELALIYEARGVPREEALRMARSLTADPELALATLAREELGLNPEELGSPWGAALASFVSFAIGAAIPLAPFLVGGGDSALAAAIALSACALFAVGATLSLFTGRSAGMSGARMLGIGAAAGTFTYLIGTLLGVTLV